MQPFEIVKETTAQQADFSTRYRDAVVVRERSTNLLPLPVMQKTLQSDVNHHVITYNLACGYEACECAAWVSPLATRNAYTYGLSQAERAVLDGHAGPFPCLLHSRRIAAYWTSLRWSFLVDHSAGDALRSLPALLLEFMDRPPQARDLGQRYRTVFFTL